MKIALIKPKFRAFNFRNQSQVKIGSGQAMDGL